MIGPSYSHPKRPRQYAAEIMRLPTREQRIERLSQVPENIREWVRYYVESEHKRNTYK